MADRETPEAKPTAAERTRHVINEEQLEYVYETGTLLQHLITRSLSVNPEQTLGQITSIVNSMGSILNPPERFSATEVRFAVVAMVHVGMLTLSVHKDLK